MSHEDRAQAEQQTIHIPPPRTFGLAASRYASSPAQASNFEQARSETAGPSQRKSSTGFQIGQLADPMAFVSAAAEKSKRLSTPPTAPKPVQHPVQKPAEILQKPALKPTQGRDSEYTDEAFVAAVNAKTFGNGFQTSNYSRFPPKPNSQQEQSGNVAGWGGYTSVGIETVGAPPVQAPATPEKRGRGVTGWQNWAKAEAQMNDKQSNKKSRGWAKPIKFEPSGWSGNDTPSPSPPKGKHAAAQQVIVMLYGEANVAIQPRTLIRRSSRRLLSSQKKRRITGSSGWEQLSSTIIALERHPF